MSNHTDFNCSNIGLCGGCFYQQESLDEELQKKNDFVKKLLDDASGEEYEYEGILQSPTVKGYRNKMEYSFGDSRKDGPLTLGLHQRKSFYNILDIYDCEIVHDDFNRIVQTVGDYFRRSGLTYVNKRSHTGYLRYLIVRRTVNTKEILVDLVTSSQAPDNEKAVLKEFVEELLDLERNKLLEAKLKGILHTRNDTLSDAVRDDGTQILYGINSIEEELLGLRFKIGPFSFFQTNSKSAELLYSKAREYISGALDKQKTVFDLYSGTGTIAQVIAPSAKKVVGVEIVEEAVEAAKENAKRNHLDNCMFLCGDVLEAIDKINEKPDVIILDPPREGINPKALRKIIAFGVDSIVYISCNPESLARDLAAFRISGYRLIKAVSVNQFPRTKHIEAVTLLERTPKQDNDGTES